MSRHCPVGPSGERCAWKDWPDRNPNYELWPTTGHPGDCTAYGPPWVKWSFVTTTPEEPSR